MEMHRFLRISLKLMVLKGKDEKQDFFFYLPTENENIARTKKYIYTYIEGKLKSFPEVFILRLDKSDI